MAGGKVSGPRTRDTPPVPDDMGMVTRPIISGPIPVVFPVPVIVEEEPSTDAVVTAVPASAVAVVILAANPARLGFSIRNSSSTAWLYVKASIHGAPVSPTFHTVALSPCGYYEDPFHYVGEVTGIWANGPLTGDALVTEYLP